MPKKQSMLERIRAMSKSGKVMMMMEEHQQQN
jgi:hypothetical protein